MHETHDPQETEEIVYRLLVVVGTGSADRLAAETGIRTDVLESALTSLIRKGLVSRTGRDSTQFRATLQPSPDILDKLNEQIDDLDRARATVGALLVTYQKIAECSVKRPVEVLVGIETVHRHLVQMCEETLHEMMWLCKSQGFFAIINQVSDGKIHNRVLLDKNSLPGDEPLTSVAPGRSPNALFRLLPRVSMDLVISDYNTGLWILTEKTQATSPQSTAVIVHDEGTVETLRLLFETQWETSLPLPSRASGRGGTADPSPTDLDEVDIKMLTLLIEGATEKFAARNLGVSLRTFQRRLRRLMILAGASNRMQLAWQAARRGWLR
ncbi:hypothetical protein [Streptomyces sp. NPDC002159]